MQKAHIKLKVSQCKEQHGKPPTIRVNVSGFMAELFQAASASQDNITDWSALQTLPSFQMFLSELSGNDVGNLDEWILPVMMTCTRKFTEQEFLDMYIAWFEDSGRWPNETPFGELKNV